MISKPRHHLLHPACGEGPINIFFAGSGFSYDYLYDFGIRKRLLSWHANTEKDIRQYIEAQQQGRESFGIIDSGAFTVWNKGGTLSLDEYHAKLQKLMPYFDMVANLDVIPGEQGMRDEITPEMNDRAAEASWNNYVELKRRVAVDGHDPARVMPIYHQGESLDWLRRIVDSGCDYIGISPSNDCGSSRRRLWLDDVYEILTAQPKLAKTHGYAVTSPTLMTEYPWYSVDSSSWVQLGAFGGIFTPYGSYLGVRKDGRFEGAKWPPEMKQKLADYFEYCGTNFDDVVNNYKCRWRVNIIYHIDLEESCSFKPRQRTSMLFD